MAWGEPDEAAMAGVVKAGGSARWKAKMPAEPIANPPRKRRNRSDLRNVSMAFFPSILARKDGISSGWVSLW